MRRVQQTRLACGVRPDLVALVDIPYVNAHRARLLFDRGLRSLKDVAAAGPDQVAAALLAGVFPLEVPSCRKSLSFWRLAKQCVKASHGCSTRASAFQFPFDGWVRLVKGQSRGVLCSDYYV